MSVNSYLTNLACSAIVRDTEKESINRSIDNLIKNLNHNRDYFSDHFIFGSYNRGTILPRIVDDKSDIDYMIVFKDNTFKPQTYLNWIKDNIAEKYYSNSQIYQSSPTIVLELNHIKFELVPAIKGSWGQLQIPAKASDYNSWLDTDPTSFNSTLTSANQRHNNLIKPLVRLVKYWNVKAGYPFESFDLEKKIVNYHYYGNTALKDYFYNFTISLTHNPLTAQWKKDKITKLKDIVNEAKQWEICGYELQAEKKIQSLFE